MLRAFFERDRPEYRRPTPGVMRNTRADESTRKVVDANPVSKKGVAAGFAAFTSRAAGIRTAFEDMAEGARAAIYGIVILSPLSRDTG